MKKRRSRLLFLGRVSRLTRAIVTGTRDEHFGSVLRYPM